jgi:bifunctional non-homologous end joining protein LigD
LGKPASYANIGRRCGIFRGRVRERAAARVSPRRVESTVDIDGRPVVLSNPDKILFPRDTYAKRDLVAYYRTMAPHILPYLRDRPLTIERFPDGIDGPTWWEKAKPRGLPAWVRTAAVDASTRRDHIDFVVCDDEATLTYIANLGSIVLHVWYSHLPTLDTPDFILIDLDPYECGIATLARVALRFREELANIGLQALVKTTGGTGLHVVVPLEPRYDYDMAKNFAQLLAQRVNGAAPSDTTLERAIAKRPKGTVYLDFVQVGKGKTYVAPFSVRARDGAPVSMPLRWPEVEAMRRKRAPETSREMARWTIANVPALVQKHGDPWSGPGWAPQRLEAALTAARSLWV